MSLRATDECRAARGSTRHGYRHLAHVDVARRLRRRPRSVAGAPDRPGRPGSAPVALRPDAPGGRPLAGAAARPGRRVPPGTQHVRTGARTLAGRLARLVGKRAAVSRPGVRVDPP